MRHRTLNKPLDKNVVAAFLQSLAIVIVINISYGLMVAHLQVMALHGTLATPLCPINEEVNEPDYLKI
jgi:hypothetical protein